MPERFVLAYILTYCSLQTACLAEHTLHSRLINMLISESKPTANCQCGFYVNITMGKLTWHIINDAISEGVTCRLRPHGGMGGGGGRGHEYN